MSRDLFGTDGVRGLAGEYPLNSDGARRIGMAVGSHFAKPGQTILIGCDPRESSAKLVADLTAGLNTMGVNVVSAGVLPTPGLAYLTREHAEFVAGVMVTASHNTYQYNGVKVFDQNGDKLSDETETILNKLIVDGVPERGQGSASQDKDLVKQYEDFLIGTASGLQLHGLKVAIDSANGAASGIAERVFKRLGATVVPLFDHPDGRNINDGCGATDIAALQKVVAEQKLDLGIAVDGDADRVIMVDNRGREVKGDYMLYLLAVVRQAEGVVTTVMSNQGFANALTKRGIKLLRTDVGDRYVLEGLKQTGYKLGGEASGHIIFPLVLKTGDGLLAAVQTVRGLETSGKSLAQWCDEVQLLPQALVNIPLANKALVNQPAVQEFISGQNAKLGGGRLLIRPSGTEPLARVMVEAPEAQAKAQKIAIDLQEVLKQVTQKQPGMRDFPHDFANQTQALTEEMFQAEDAALVRQLAEKGYEIHVGLTTAFADDIAKMCRQPSIKEFCPNDSGRRFKDRAATKNWLAKGRAAFLLIKKEDHSLAGYGWAGSESSAHTPGGQTTFAIRIGEEGQGQGLATPFARLIVAGASKLYRAQDFWLETWASNGGAVHVYHKIGFTDVDQQADERPTTNGQTVPDTRFYMTLANDLLQTVD